MRMQWYTYRVGKTLNYADTYREDLPKSGYLSSIFLRVNGAGVTDAFNALEKWRMVDWLSSIKVLGDTNDVLQSYTGRLLQAAMIDKGYPAIRSQEFNYGSSTKRFQGYINFGRKAGDKTYGLDLSRYNNVEIQVSNDAAVGQFASGMTVDLYLCLLHDTGGGNPFSGFFRTEEYRKITTTASKIDYIDLPSQGKLRRMLLQVDPTVDSAENAQRSLYQTLDNVKYTLRSGAEEHLNCNPRHLWDLAYLNGRDVVITGGEPYHTSLEGVRTGLGQTIYKASVALPQGMASATPTLALEAGNDSSTQKLLRTGTDNASFLFAGHGPENTFTICHDWPEDSEENYLDLAAQTVAQLELTTGSNANDTSATYRLLLDRLLP